MSILENISNVLAEPGYRQLIVLGTSTVLGTLTRIAEMASKAYAPIFTKKEFPPAFSIGVPTAIAIEEAVRNVPVMENYAIEASADLVIAATGYKIGDYAGRKIGDLFGYVSQHPKF